MIFGFIDEHKQRFPVQLMCDTLGVSTSGYYAARSRPDSPRELQRNELASEIRSVHAQSQEIYGSPRVHQSLLRAGRHVCRNTVAKLMKSLGIKARSHRRFRVATTDSAHPHRIAPDRLQRRFAVAELNRVWASDITYVPTDEGFLYVAGVMDLASRRIVGWSMSTTMHGGWHKLTSQNNRRGLSTRATCFAAALGGDACADPPVARHSPQTAPSSSALSASSAVNQSPQRPRLCAHHAKQPPLCALLIPFPRSLLAFPKIHVILPHRPAHQAWRPVPGVPLTVR